MTKDFWTPELILTLRQISTFKLIPREELELFTGPLPEMPEKVAVYLGQNTQYSVQEWREAWRKEPNETKGW